MTGVIDTLEREQLRRVPAFDAGDRVKVHFQVVEGSRRRTQVFEGVVIKRQGAGARETFTVRKVSFGVGVERTFPLHTPKIERIEVASRGDVRRAKLYYLRGRVGRRARVRERQDVRGLRDDAGAGPSTAGQEAAAEAPAGGSEAAGEPGEAVSDASGSGAEAESADSGGEVSREEPAAPAEAEASSDDDAAAR